MKFPPALTCGLVALALVAGCGASASQNVNQSRQGQPSGATAAATPAATPAAAPASADASAAKPFDPCALLTSEEIKGVQGEAVREAKSSRRDDPNFSVGQCFYATPTFTKSVSLEVTRRGGDGTQSVRDFWKASFARAEQKREAKNERRKKSGKPQAGPPASAIRGVGDEAYWIGTNANGTLYAFKKDALVRISLGGAESNDSRLAKAKTLAQKALARL